MGLWVGKKERGRGGIAPVYLGRAYSEQDSFYIGGLEFRHEHPRGWLTWCAICPQTPTVDSGRRHRKSALDRLHEHYVIEHPR